MAKRKSKKEETDYQLFVADQALSVDIGTLLDEPESEAVEGQEVDLKCVWSGPVTVQNTPSGNVYKFQPGQVLPVWLEDKDHLLGLQKKNDGCCGGGANQPPLNYFTEA